MSTPSDAAALIEKLRAHPKACGMLGITVTQILTVCVSDDISIWNDYDAGQRQFVRFRRWLVGACVEKFHELDLDLPVRCMSNGVPYYAINDGNEISHPAFLAAALAALENHDATP